MAWAIFVLVVLVVITLIVSESAIGVSEIC